MSDAAQIAESTPSAVATGSDDLIPIVYEQLCRLARRQLSFEAPDHSHQTVDLVHEAYLRLSSAGYRWQNQAHFLGAAAEAMRRILVERARRRRRIKHGGGRARVDLHDDVASLSASIEEVLIVDDLLDSLAAHHPREAQLVKLHYFAGLSISEAGRALGLPSSTAHRYWTFARTWLHEASRGTEVDYG